MPKIYTKTGDKGHTSLYDCSRVEKTHELIDLLGDIDELNSFIGNIDEIHVDILNNIQIWLFDLGTLIANPIKKYNFDVNQEYTKKLEAEIDEMNGRLPKLTNFILPTGSINIARAVCRRVERKLVSVIKDYEHTHINDNAMIFINRLSDYLFQLSRYAHFLTNKQEVIYHKSEILSLIDNFEQMKI